ncbi:Fe-S oxidoreductase [Caldimicrobium thiodismutans]|jgi:Fe-S-cluster containining protein|uniref:Fe-S oxidoreductase n=1 Tax=Caldimicrobium thiodismutans TaxID=1653476 RepID=A0A0U4N1X6_9BACT|nr:YkgJ family cysteine cluster protein [Caldimicrobium thiodismutans]BAU23238.1 Fe-S oxidoreductase [Caldimicrobium thiodismutans]
MTRLFECQRCGACCQGESTVSLSPEKIEEIAEFLNLSKEELFHKYLIKKGKNRIEMKTKNGACIFYDRKRKSCQIHPVKPEKCKEWPFPPSIFTDKKNFLIIQNSCQGLKKLSYEDLKTTKS